MEISRFSGKVLLAAAVSIAAPSYAQQVYPARPLRLIVPYPPGGPTDLIGRLTSDVLAKRLARNVVVDNRGGAATAIGAEMAKKLRLLAVASAKRSAAAPEIPTFAEGGVPGFQVNGWNCLVAPRATPQQVIKRLNAEIVAGFSQPEVVERLRKQSIDAAAGTPDQLAAYMKSEIARYHKLIKAVGLTAD